MNRKRIVRSWWLWGLLVLFVIFVLPSVLSGGNGYHGVSTSEALTQIRTGNVTNAVENDKEQTLQLTLKKPLEGKYAKVETQFPARATNTIVNALDKAQAGPAHTQWRTHVSKE